MCWLLCTQLKSGQMTEPRRRVKWQCEVSNRRTGKVIFMIMLLLCFSQQLCHFHNIAQTLKNFGCPQESGVSYGG